MLNKNILTVIIYKIKKYIIIEFKKQKNNFNILKFTIEYSFKFPKYF